MKKNRIQCISYKKKYYKYFIKNRVLFYEHCHNILFYNISELVIIIGKYLTFAKQDLTVKILVEPERM